MILPPGDGRSAFQRTLSASLIAAALCLPCAANAQGDVRLPVPLSEPTADWPPGRAQSQDLVVPVTLEVLADGTVAKVTLDRSFGAEIDGAAIAAAQKLKFRPARRDDKPIAARIRSVVRFAAMPPPPLTATAPAASPAPASTATALPGQPAPPPAPASAAAQLPPASAPAANAQPISVRVQGEAPPRSASEVVRDTKILRAAPHRTASDLLVVVPGVFVTQHSGEGKAHQIFLRGFDAVHGQDVEIWAGGAPVNEVSNIHGQGYADLHFLMPEVVSSLRAEPGTYDPRQGDFAVAGSAEFSLGYSEPGFSVKGTLGMQGVKRLFLAYHPPSADARTFAAFETYATDGFGPSRAASRNSLVAQAAYDFGPVSGRVLVTTFAGRFDSAGVVRLADIQSGKVDRFATYDPRQGGFSSRTQVVLDLSHSGDDGDFSVAPYFVLRSLKLRQNFTGYLEDPVNGDSTQQINEAVTVGAKAHYRKKIPLLSPSDAFEIGVSARSDWIDQSQRQLSVVDDHITKTLVDTSVQGTDVAGYLDAQIKPLRRLTVRGGLRVDGLSYATQDRLPESGDQGGQARSALGAHFGAKGTVDFTVVPGLHALASAGQGFRSPQARSLGEGERTPFTTVDSFEGGLRYRDEVFDAYAAGFYTTLSEDLVFDNATARNERVPGTERAGFSIDLVIHPTAWLTHASSLTYTRAQFTGSDKNYRAGDLLPYVPQLIVRTDFSVTPTLMMIRNFPLQGHLGVGATLLHNRPLPYSEIGNDVFVADASASARYRYGEFGVQVYNLFDAHYYDGQFVYASNFARGSTPALVPVRHVTAGPPFTALFSLSLFLS